MSTRRYDPENQRRHLYRRENLKYFVTLAFYRTSFSHRVCIPAFLFTKMVLLKAVHPLKIYQHTTVRGDTFTGAFRTHLRNLRVRHFVMIGATGLKLYNPGHLQWHDLLNEVNKILLTIRLLRGDSQTDKELSSHKPHFMG
jgi:hypothetical protein